MGRARVVAKIIHESDQWYVKKGSRVQGPYTACEISRFVSLGRVRVTDSVTNDGENWYVLTCIAEMIPEDFLHFGSSVYTPVYST